MSTKKNSTDNVSIEEIFKIFLKEKITIIIISLAFSILFGLLYYYGIDQIKKNQKLSSVEVTLVNKDFKYILKYYKNYLPVEYSLQNGNIFKDFEFEISDLNLADFFEQNKDRFDDFSDYFEKSNIEAQVYFSENFKKKRKDYFFRYPRELKGETLIKEFITSEIYRFEKESKTLLKKNLVIYKNYIEKIIQILTKNNLDTNFNNYENNLFITKKILEALDDNTLNPSLTFNFLTEVKTLKNKYSINSLKNFIFVGLVFGFFLSLIIVFFKDLIRKNKL